MMNNLGGCVPVLEDHLVAGLLQRKWITSAALAVLVWDYLLSSGDEWRCVWRRPFSGVKAIYVYARYMPLAVQSVNLYLVLGPLLSNIPIEDPEPCFRWWLLLLLASSTLLSCLDVVLSLRIYALYRKNKQVAMLLVTALLGLFLTQIVMGTLVMSNLSFNCLCDTDNHYPPVVWLAVVIWIVQLLIGSLLLGKRGLTYIGSRVVKIVHRDGVLILALICAIFAFIVPYSTLKRTYEAHIIMVAPISLVSIACCRAILNLLTVNREADSSRLEPETYILTAISIPNSANTNNSEQYSG